MIYQIDTFFGPQIVTRIVEYFLHFKAPTVIYNLLALVLGNVWMFITAALLSTKERITCDKLPRRIVAWFTVSLLSYFLVPYCHTIITAAFCEVLFIITAIPMIILLVVSLVALLLYGVVKACSMALSPVLYYPSMLVSYPASLLWSLTTWLVSQTASLICSLDYSTIVSGLSNGASLTYFVLTHELFWIITLIVAAYLGYKYYCKKHSKAKKKPKLPTKQKRTHKESWARVNKRLKRSD